jgi:hypothetical protein
MFPPVCHVDSSRLRLRSGAARWSVLGYSSPSHVDTQTWDYWYRERLAVVSIRVIYFQRVILSKYKLLYGVFPPLRSSFNDLSILLFHSFSSPPTHTTGSDKLCFTDCEVTQRATALMEHLLERFRYAKDDDNNKNKRLWLLPALSAVFPYCGLRTYSAPFCARITGFLPTTIRFKQSPRANDAIECLNGSHT